MQQWAIDCGNYGPSHFIKEFRKLSGNKPSTFMTLPIPEDDPLTYIGIKKVDFLQQEAGSFLLCLPNEINKSENMEKIKQQAIDLLNKCEILTLASIDERGCSRLVILSKIKAEGIDTIWFSTGTSSEKTKDCC